MALAEVRTRPRAAEVRRDLLAGVVVGVIALPLSIALAVAVGVSPVVGLYTAAFAGAAATLFGGSRFNITGPTAALVPVLSHVVLVHGAGALPVVGALAGLLLLGLSALRAGRLMRYMPGLVVVGFTAGIALSIAFGQLNALLAVTGTDPGLERFHERIWDTLRHLETVGALTPLLGLGSLAVLLIWRRVPVLHRVPGPLVVVAAVTVLVWGLHLDTPTLGSRYGEIQAALPVPSLSMFDLSLVWVVLPSAFAVAVLGGVETLLSAVVADDMTMTTRRHDPNRELFGQGVANLVSPIMGGMPATAAIARTAAGIRAGGDSRLTGLTHSATVLLATLVLGRLTGHIPLTVLAAVLCSVAWNIAEAPEIVRLVRRAPREDVLILLATIFITLFFDLTYAIGFGVLASAVLLVRRMTGVPGAQQLLPDAEGRIQQVSPGLSELIRSRPDISVFTAAGLLSFHCAAALEYELTAERRGPLVLRMKDVHYIDATGLLTLEEVVKHRRRNGDRTMLSAIQPEVRGVLTRFGLIDLVGPENVFEGTRDAIDAVPVPVLDGQAGGTLSAPAR